jgi:uncharacterized protein involved in exopolysaccharide biosynthesis
VVVKLLPKLYTATATLMVSYEVNDPLAGKEFPIQLLTSYISTQMEIMQSPEVLLAVVDRLKLAAEEEFTTGYRGDGTTLNDWVKDQLVKRLSVAQGNLGSQLVYIKASARTPAQAAALANAVATVYLEQNLQRTTGPAAERADRYSAHLAELKSNVDVAQEHVAAYRQRTGIADLTVSDKDVDQTLLTNLEQRYQEAQNLRRAAEVKQSTDHAASDQVAGSTLMQSLKSQLASQQAQMAQLRATLGPQHPRVLELQSQLQSTHSSIESAVRTFSGSASVELKETRTLEEKLRRAVEEQRAKVLNVRNVQDEGAKLRVELESAQAAYRRALDGHDQITLPGREPYTNVHLLTRAQPPAKADKPNKLKLLLMGLVAGVGLGLVIPVCYELLVHRRVRCRDDIERDLGIDVLVELHAIPVHGSPA